jgi:hypothetical protein
MLSSLLSNFSVSIYCYQKVGLNNKLFLPLKSPYFWDIMMCSPLKVKQVLEEQADSKLAACFILVSCLAYSLTLKMEVTCSSETLVDFGLHGIISWKIGLLITTAVRTSNLT